MNKIVNRYYHDCLVHHGIKGQKWGIQNGPPYPLNQEKSRFNSPTEMYDWMKNNITISEFTKLKDANTVYKTHTGSSHDLVMFELSELKKMGYDPQAMTLYRYNNKTKQINNTHSFVYYEEKDGETAYWIEPAWKNCKGLHKYSYGKWPLLDDAFDFFLSEYDDEYDDEEGYIYGMTYFGEHKPGETFQEFTSKLDLKF